MAVFSRLLPVAASAIGLQAVCASVFVPLANETYFDLCGSLGFLSTAFVSLYYPALRAKARFLLGNGTNVSLPSLSSFSPRQLLLTTCLSLWAARMGVFLADRAIKAGGDSRFDRIRHRPGLFSSYWVGQAAWVFTVGLPVWLVNTTPVSQVAALRPRDLFSLGLFATSFAIEVCADYQKSNWRRARNNKEHDEKFITKGLWGISRHPNYVGEIGTWTGIWALAVPALTSPAFPRWTPALAALSPLFTYWLVRFVTGVPPLERIGDAKYGSDPKWHEYKRTVPIFFPWIAGQKNHSKL